MCFRPGDTGVENKPVVCPSCGEDNPPGEPVCIFCGTELLAESVAPAAPSAPSAPAAVPGPKAPTA